MPAPTIPEWLPARLHSNHYLYGVEARAVLDYDPALGRRIEETPSHKFVKPGIITSFVVVEIFNQAQDRRSPLSKLSCDTLARLAGEAFMAEYKAAHEAHLEDVMEDTERLKRVGL